MIVRYSANRVSAFTFLTPLFGVAAGHLVLDEPLNWAFGAAAVLVIAGLVLVNRPSRTATQTRVGARGAAPQARFRAVARHRRCGTPV